MIARVVPFFLTLSLLISAEQDWPVYHGDKAASHYSSLDQINRSNVSKLELAWTFRTARKGTLQCNPLVIDGLVYLVDQNIHLHALNGRNGETQWTFVPPGGRGGTCRGLMHWQSDDDQEKRLFLSAGNFVYAVDKTTGKGIESFGIDGRIDLRNELDTDGPKLTVSLNTPGVVHQDLLILGSRVGEGPQQAAPGHVRAFDTRTGKRRWIFHTIPHPGEVGHDTWPADAWKRIGGANSWGGISLDAARDLVFFATGSPSYDHFGGNRLGQNLFGNCVMALRASTGAYVWHYQVVHHDLWDYDVPCQPNLVTVTHDGKKIDAVAQSTKMGHVFLLDLETGKPLFPVEERPVPQSTVPGEVSWPTQPFPSKPPALAKQRFSEEDITDLNPAATAAVQAFIKEKNLLLGDVFIPPGLQSSVVIPQFNGGGEWGGAGYDPSTGWLYVNVSNEPEWNAMVPAKPREDITQGELGQRLFQAICANCHGNKAFKSLSATPLPALATVKERLTSDQVATLLETGRGQMPSFAALSETERSSIVAYLYGEGTDERIPKEDLTSAWTDEIPYLNTGHHEFRDPDGYPVNKRPWGTLKGMPIGSL